MSIAAAAALLLAGCSNSEQPSTEDLAGRIQQAQDPEIQQLDGWLEEWDAGGTGHSMPGMEHGAGPGMMTDDEMRQLEQAGGAEFDRMFLQLMTKHHRGAIEMARTEQQAGASPEAKTLARRIIDGQQAEITEMRGLLAAQ